MKNLILKTTLITSSIFMFSCDEDDEMTDPVTNISLDSVQNTTLENVLADVLSTVSIDATATGVDPSDQHFEWTLTKGATQPARGNNEVYVTENIAVETQWVADSVYILRGRITVLDGITLTIEAGTRIEGDETLEGPNAAVLMIARGGKLMAEGTADDPIVMTSTADDGNLTSQDKGKWGGLVVLGKAPISADAEEDQIEGVPGDDTNGLYGGQVDDDNSGVIQYVSIRHGGAIIDAAAGNEINGLTLGGVGSGTTIDHIEVYANNDDGVEFFGGTVDVEWIVVTQVGDDAIDIDQSYAGTVANYLVYVDSDSDEFLEIDGREGTMIGKFSLLNGTIETIKSASITCDFKSRATGSVTNLSAIGGVIKLAASFDVDATNITVTSTEDAAQNVIDGKLSFDKVNVASLSIYTDDFE